MNPAQLLSKGIDLNLGKFSFSPSYLQAGAFLILVFILVLLLAKLRRGFVDWSLKGSLVGLFFGFLLALILEGFLIIGGKTAVTEMLGWKNPPKFVANILEVGKGKLVKVLGSDTEYQIPKITAGENPTFEDAVSFFQSLNPEEAGKFKDYICRP